MVNKLPPIKNGFPQTILTLDDFDYREGKFLFLLFDYTGGLTRTAKILGIKQYLSLAQWRDLGYVPSLRVPHVAKTFGVTPFLLNYPFACEWAALFDKGLPYTWERYLQMTMKNKDFMTEETYEKIIAAPSVFNSRVHNPMER